MLLRGRVEDLSAPILHILFDNPFFPTGSAITKFRLK